MDEDFLMIALVLAGIGFMVMRGAPAETVQESEARRQAEMLARGRKQLADLRGQVKNLQSVGKSIMLARNDLEKPLDRGMMQRFKDAREQLLAASESVGQARSWEQDAELTNLKSELDAAEASLTHQRIGPDTRTQASRKSNIRRADINANVTEFADSVMEEGNRRGHRVDFRRNTRPAHLGFVQLPGTEFHPRRRGFAPTQHTRSHEA